MNANELAKAITELEGKHESVSIAQVKEIIGIVADGIFAYPDVLHCLVALGIKRYKNGTQKFGYGR